MKNRNITGDSFRRFVLKADSTKQANGLYVYNPYYERYGYVNDENLEQGKIPYRVKVHYNKKSKLGKGILMNINDLIIVDKRDYAKGGDVLELSLESDLKKIKESSSFSKVSPYIRDSQIIIEGDYEVYDFTANTGDGAFVQEPEFKSVKEIIEALKDVKDRDNKYRVSLVKIEEEEEPEDNNIETIEYAYYLTPISSYEKGGETTNYDYDYEDIGQFAMRGENWKYFTQEDFKEMGKEITETAFNGDLDMAYESIVRQRNRFQNGGMTKSDYLKNKYRQVEFVDEDTAELIKVDIPISTDDRRSKSYSPSEEKRQRKYEKKDLKHWSKLEDIQSDISTLKEKLKEEKSNYEQLFSDMNHEAGQKAEKWTDTDANRYGGDMNDSLIKIKAIEELIGKTTDNYNNIEEEYLK